MSQHKGARSPSSVATTAAAASPTPERKETEKPRTKEYERPYLTKSVKSLFDDPPRQPRQPRTDTEAGHKRRRDHQDDYDDDDRRDRDRSRHHSHYRDSRSRRGEYSQPKRHRHNYHSDDHHRRSRDRPHERKTARGGEPPRSQDPPVSVPVSRFVGLDDKKDSALAAELSQCLAIEAHHIHKVVTDSDGQVTNVEWCYAYVAPGIGRANGGQQVLHHRCRRCQRVCLHLLGKPGTGSRFCLHCAESYDSRRVPDWYVHPRGTCRHCEGVPSSATRGGGRGGRGRSFHNNRRSRY